MSTYARLGILGVRWLGVVFLSLAVVPLLVGVTGPWTMGGMMGMGYGEGMTELSEQMTPGWGGMMTGGVGLWWGPTLLFALVGVILLLAGRPLGSMIASGLDD
jgi:hypothetical protein